MQYAARICPISRKSEDYTLIGYLEQTIERFASDEGIEAAGVEAERTENVGQRSQDLARRGNVLDEKRVQHDVCEALVLKR